ncbi:uncharacterized protein BX663DRAFT_436612, partial [Cokeromyces recurvatus]|uniref:uncharacterized protein n=1 Tax=Cokeromyces recurvatus TaxID=90255 RepID=UPI00221EF370
YSTQTNVPNVWVITNGGLESTLQAMALGKHLAGSKELSNTFKLKTITASERLQLFPVVLQKYIINCGQDAIPACFHLSNICSNQKPFTVYVGYPGIPFINFDQVILPKYEANAKMAALGPLAKQKNGIITPAPLLDLVTDTHHELDRRIPISFKQNFSVVVVGGYSPNCRWYSEDAVSLADNIKRMITRLGDKVILIFTDRTSELVKSKMSKRLLEDDPTLNSSIFIWDSTKEQISTIDKIKLYENMIYYSKRVVLTADLDYVCTHAISKKYITELRNNESLETNE